MDRASDNTPLFTPRGELPVDDDGGRVQCHLCGRWLRQIGSSHVLHAHGMTAADYRLLAGLRPGHPLQAPDLSATCTTRLRRRITTDARLISGMAAGVVLLAGRHPDAVIDHGQLADATAGRLDALPVKVPHDAALRPISGCSDRLQAVHCQLPQPLEIRALGTELLDEETRVGDRQLMQSIDPPSPPLRRLVCPES